MGEFTITPVNPNDDPDLAWDTKALKEQGVLGVHRHPKANKVDYYRARGVSLKIPLSPVMYNAKDLDDDTVVLESYTTPVNGGVITTNATRLFYAPTSDEHDSFNFTVTDGRGGRGSSSVNIWVKDYVGKVAITLS